MLHLAGLLLWCLCLVQYAACAPVDIASLNTLWAALDANMFKCPVSGILCIYASRWHHCRATAPAA